MQNKPIVDNNYKNTPVDGAINCTQTNSEIKAVIDCAKNKIDQYVQLEEKLHTYLNQKEIDLIYKAFQFCKKAHQGQKRNSGEDYFYHPLSVAHILVDMRADSVSIICSLLHDVIEDTPFSKADIVREFNDEIADIVDGVSKLTHFKFDNIQDKQAENFLKMFLAMCKDVRVMLVKVADRLHNMRTINSLSPEKQRLKAKETLEIYAPISMRLGLSRIQYELEDLGLRYLYPDRYRVLDEKIVELAKGHKDFISEVETAIKKLLATNKIAAKVFGRRKNLYSLYNKMRFKKVSFEQIEDTYAFRIIVSDVATCYQVLGILHSFYAPIPKTVEDYIAMPKFNGYQSLHTEVITSYGVRVEVQIRTEEMNQIAEFGIAAHWRYKVRGATDYEKNARNWISRVIETKEGSLDPIDFLERMKMDLQPHEVYVITPKGQIFRMPYDSIGVDFAFAIHTDIGLKAQSMIVNGRYRPITANIHSGERIEIVIASEAKVKFEWIYLVKTAKAKDAINAYFKNIDKTHYDQLKSLGESMLNQALKKYGINDLQVLSDKKIQSVLDSFNLLNSGELFVSIAQGKLIANQIAKEFLDNNIFSKLFNSIQLSNKKIKQQIFSISAKNQPLAQFSRCCGPVPGDDIISQIRLDGFVVHRANCKTIQKIKSKNPQQCVKMAWDQKANEDLYRSSFRIMIKNEADAFAKITAIIGASNIEVENIRHSTINYKNKMINCVVLVHNQKEIEGLINAIGSHAFVKSINRS